MGPKEQFFSLFYSQDTVIRSPGLSKLFISLVHTGRRVVLGHTLSTWQHIITKKSHNVLNKFTILCWTAFIAVLDHMRPAGHGLDTPGLSHALLQSSATGQAARQAGLDFEAQPPREEPTCLLAFFFFLSSFLSSKWIDFIERGRRGRERDMSIFAVPLNNAFIA